VGTHGYRCEQKLGLGPSRAVWLPRPDKAVAVENNNNTLQHTLRRRACDRLLVSKSLITNLEDLKSEGKLKPRDVYELRILTIGEEKPLKAFTAL
jgi:hypothetical protein